MAEGHITVVPEVLVTGGGGALDGLAATLMRTLHTGSVSVPSASLANGAEIVPADENAATPARNGATAAAA